MNEERRQSSTIRRQINETGWPDIGKALCVYILYRNVDTITTHWDALAVLLICLIAPRLIEKVVGGRLSPGQITTTVDTHDRHEVVVKPKVDNPQAPMGV